MKQVKEMGKKELMNHMFALVSEVQHLYTMLEPHDTGHIHTTIGMLNRRIDDFNKYLDTLEISKIDRKNELRKFKINIILQNIEFIIFIIALIILIIGFIFYFRRQYKVHKHHWNTLTFLFGRDICDNSILPTNNKPKNKPKNKQNY